MCNLSKKSGYFYLFLVAFSHKGWYNETTFNVYKCLYMLNILKEDNHEQDIPNCHKDIGRRASLAMVVTSLSITGTTADAKAKSSLSK